MTWERYATGAWLSPRLMTFTAGLMLAGTVAALGYLIFAAQGTLDVFGRPLGTDFSSFWTAGRMALRGEAASAYDWLAHFAEQRAVHGTDGFQVPWSYPPMFLVVAAGFARLPYLPSLLVWQATTLVLALAVFRAIIPSARALLFALGFPAVFLCLAHGQTAFLAAALMAGGVLLLRRREALAGVLFGLLTFKPQLGLLLPFALLAGGYWRAIAAAAGTFAAVAAVTLALWGWPVWQAFLDSLPASRAIVFEAGDTGFHKFQSLFAWVRLVGGSVGSAYAAQAVAALAALAGCAWVWRRQTPLELKGAALLIGSLIASPYVLDYDFVLFGMALALLVAHGLDHGFVRWEKTLLAVGWFSPLVARSLAQALFVPLGFLVLAAMFVLVLIRANAREASAGASGAAG